MNNCKALLVSETQRKLWDYSKKTIKKALVLPLHTWKNKGYLGRIYYSISPALVSIWYQNAVFSFFEGLLRSKTLDTSDFLLEGQTTVSYSHSTQI